MIRKPSSRALGLQPTKLNLEIKQEWKLFGTNHSPSLTILMGIILGKSYWLKITACVTQQVFFLTGSLREYHVWAAPSVSHSKECNPNCLGTAVPVPYVSYIGNLTSSSWPPCPLTSSTRVSSRPYLLRNSYKCQISSLCNDKCVLPYQVVMTSDILLFPACPTASLR